MLFIIILGIFLSSVSCVPNCENGCTKNCLRGYLRCYLKSNTITIVTAVDQAPLISQTGNNAPTGFDADLMNYIGNIYQTNFTYQYTDFSQFISVVQNNPNTISISTETDTLAREQFVNFVQFFKTGTAFVVQSTYNKTINGLSDLCGKTVVVLASSTQESDVQTQNGKCGNNGITLLSVASNTDLVGVVLNGTAEVGLEDEATLVASVSGSNNTLKLVGEQYNVAPYGILCNKQNLRLCCALANAINYLIQQGTYEELLEKYSFSYKNNGVCPSSINLAGSTCLSQCVPSTSVCQNNLS